MSRRLIVAFVAITLTMSAALILVRSFTLASELRQREAVHVSQAATVLATVLAQRWSEDGPPPSEATLREFVNQQGYVTWEPDGGKQVIVTGPEFASGDMADAISKQVDVIPDAGPDAGTVVGVVTVGQSDSRWRGVVGYDPASLVMLLVLIALTAGLTGYAMARWLSAPFSRLATAAGMLGRGRFDLDLPATRIPEAQAVSSALQASASALRDRLAREQQFSTHASHVLRTPLTSLRLHLEELDQSELGPASRETAQRCLRSVAQLDQVVVDLVDITRRGSLMSGAEIPLRDLATSSAQQWADALIQRGCGFSAAVEGDLDLAITPGPVEYVLDVLLEQVHVRSRGGCDDEVRLVFVGARDVLRIEVAGVGGALTALNKPSSLPDGALPRVDQAASLVRSLGGRMEAGDEGCVRVLIPPR